MSENLPSESTQDLYLKADDIRLMADLSAMDFARSSDIPRGSRRLGQERAIDALEFGTRIDKYGYNVFVLGLPGGNRHGLAEAMATKQAAGRPAPDDWCYVNNFSDPESPHALSFPAGTGAVFRDDMRELIEELKVAIPAAFEGDDYRNRLRAVEAETQKEVEKSWKSIEERATADGIVMMQSPTGYVLAPVRDGEVLAEEEFSKLPKKKRDRIQKSIRNLTEEIQRNIEQMPKLQKSHREQVRNLNKEVTDNAVGVLLTDLKRKYATHSSVVEYLDAVERDIAENAHEFQQSEHSQLPFLKKNSSQLFAKYEVNLIVSNEESLPAPVVYEPNPSYFNVIGKVEQRAELGALVTDYRMVRSGALHRANGGYLILDAQRVLGRPFVWEALKQALFANRIRIESPGETYGFTGTATMKPEPIALDVKIILIGERWHYYLLCRYDSEFSDLFKVAADLDDDVSQTVENLVSFTQLIADRIRAHELLPFSKGAMQKVIEQRLRLAGDQRRLSTHLRSLDDLLTQADYWARRRSADTVDKSDIQKAIDSRLRQHDRMELRVADAIQRDMLLIDTSGAAVGQVNGLSVVDLGEHRFGHPVRITATTRIGAGELVDIEREVELGGAIHSKGMLILSAALKARYAAEVPLSLSGSVVFEQTYGGVDGDSASVAELCALLSSLSNEPILQNFAVTGSINQHGRVQVVGGINEKIEGYFQICKERGLDGSHGVIIPRGNVPSLMLKEEIVAAVAAGQFRIAAVRDIDEALTVLIGKEAGARDEAGKFPADTVNWKVERQLIHYAEMRKQFGSGADDREREQR